VFVARVWVLINSITALAVSEENVRALFDARSRQREQEDEAVTEKRELREGPRVTDSLT